MSLINPNDFPPTPETVVAGSISTFNKSATAWVGPDDLTTMAATLRAWLSSVTGISPVVDVNPWIPTKPEILPEKRALSRAIGMWLRFELPYDYALKPTTSLMLLIEGAVADETGVIDLSIDTIRSRRGSYATRQGLWTAIRRARRDLKKGACIVHDTDGRAFRAFTFPNTRGSVASLIDAIGLQGWYGIQLTDVTPLRYYSSETAVQSRLVESLTPVTPPLVGPDNQITDERLHNIKSFDRLLATTMVMLPIANRHDPQLANDLALLTAHWRQLSINKAAAPSPSPQTRAEMMWVAYVLRRTDALFKKVNGTPQYAACLAGAQYRMYLMTTGTPVSADKPLVLVLPYMKKCGFLPVLRNSI